MEYPLELSFPDSGHVVIRFGPKSSPPLAFADPIAAADHEDIRWYLEVYATRSLGDPDSLEAARVSSRLPDLGQALFRSVFQDAAVRSLFDEFRTAHRKRTGLLTVIASDAAILRLPWELLHEPGSTYLFASSPGVHIRRRLLTATAPANVQRRPLREGLHILFVVSRPLDASFLDPRMDSAAVMDALETAAPGKATWEFLFPPTLEALLARLTDPHRRSVNVLHFDGHGVFDRHEQTGFLLFERAESPTPFNPTSDLVDADCFARALAKAPGVALVILSACQSASQTTEGEPLGSVAARVAAAGTPAVIAMTHSVLIATTRQMFETFYRQLAHGATVGAALDAARRQLYRYPNRYKVARWAEDRGSWEEWLRLQDWFVPSLYQAGPDIPLLSSAGARSRKSQTSARQIRTNLPPGPVSGFFGRAYELWRLERGLTGAARRMTVAGFGGLGKTALVQETARWLLRTGRFDAAIYVDFSRLQVLDALPLAVSQIAHVLRRNVPDNDAVCEVLGEIATLVILDGLESLPAEALDTLLRCAASWSEAGSSRVLLATRSKSSVLTHQRLGMPRGAHQVVELKGLGSREAPDDALGWFAALMRRSPQARARTPEREALIELFDRVGFHPLSLLVLAQQLQERTPEELGSRLQQLLGSMGDVGASEEALPVLVASLKLSFERLTPEQQQAVRRLGVFHGGAFEKAVLRVTGLGDASEGRREIIEEIFARLERGDSTAVAAYYEHIVDSPEEKRARGQEPKTPQQLLQEIEWLRELWRHQPRPLADRRFWPRLLAELQRAGLVRVEAGKYRRGERFLEFHPTLTPFLWEQLDAGERSALSLAHRNEYWQTLLVLAHVDREGPQITREIVLRELPNLLSAVEAAYATRAEFADHMARHLGEFLSRFGLRRDTDRLETLYQETETDPHPLERITTEFAEARALETDGEFEKALALYIALLEGIRDDAPHAIVDIMLGLARCFVTLGWFDHAALALAHADELAEAIPNEEAARQYRCNVQIELANYLAERGDHVAAEREFAGAFDKAIAIDNALALLRITSARGSLARRAQDLPTALEHFEKARGLAELIEVPAGVAHAHVGMAGVHLDLQQWDEAEDHLREAALLYESLSHSHRMAQVWSGLAVACSGAGRLEAAKDWAHKAIAHFATRGNQYELCTTITSLAPVLLRFPDRLREARQLLRRAALILRRWSDVTSKTWQVYSVVAKVSVKRARHAASSTRRRRLVFLSRRYSSLAVRAKRVSSSRASSRVPEHLRGRLGEPNPDQAAIPAGGGSSSCS